jgi:hypothetical protein
MRVRACAPGAVGRGMWTVLVCAFALVVLGNAGAARDRHAQSTELSVDRLLRSFDVIVFHNEFDDKVDTRLRKWVDPVRIFLDVRAGNPAMLKRHMEAHVRTLVEITGYDIATVADPGAANITVVFERDNRLEQVAWDYFSTDFNIRMVMRTNLCFGHYHSNAHYEIFKAVIVIPTDRAMSRKKLAACIVEETTQVLGLPNDSDEVSPSIFNDRSTDDELTEQDAILLRLLYDSRLKPGMPREEVLRLVGEILKEMRP